MYFVYFLISKKKPNWSYVGMTMDRAVATYYLNDYGLSRSEVLEKMQNDSLMDDCIVYEAENEKAFFKSQSKYFYDAGIRVSWIKGEHFSFMCEPNLSAKEIVN